MATAPPTDTIRAIGWQLFEAPPFELDVADARSHEPVRLPSPLAHRGRFGALRPPIRCWFEDRWRIEPGIVDEWVSYHTGPGAGGGAPPSSELSFALGNTHTDGSEWLRGAFDWAHVHAVHGAQRLAPEDLQPEATTFREDWCGAIYGSSVFLVDHQTQMHQLHEVDGYHLALTVENVFRDRLDTVVTIRAYGEHAAKRTRLVRSWRRYVERRYQEDHRIWAHKAIGRSPRYGPHDREVIEFDRYWRRLGARAEP